MGALVYAWLKVINPFHSSASKKITLTAAKALIRKTRNQIKTITRNHKYAFLYLQQTSCDKDNENSKVYNLIQENWQNLSAELQKRVNIVVHRGFEDVLQKFEADVKDIETIPDEEFEYIVLTNRRIESTFSHWKHNQKNYINLLIEHSSEQSMAKQNNLGDFLGQLSKKKDWPCTLRGMKQKNDSTAKHEKKNASFSAICN